jgi:hypothetical protein
MRILRHLVRPVAVLAAGAIVATTLTAPAQAASPQGRSADWLQRQLTKGLIHNEQFDFDDYGLTADVGIALDSLHRRKAVRKIGNALAPKVDSWTTGVDFGSNDIYAGSVAKAVVLAQVAGHKPRRFGGVNLVKRLNRRVSDTKPYVGRIQDRGQDDFANTIGQVFATAGLARARSGKAAEARRFLLRQQCAKGFFRLNFAPKDERKQGCDAGTRAESAPDTDVTALAVLALNGLPKQDKQVRRAVTKAVRWLKRTQRNNGSFGGGPTTGKSNANSSGLAAWALGDHGACQPAAKAARWVKGLQVNGALSGTPLAGERGAIAYNRAALKAAEADGITTETRDQWRRATAQAAPALAFLNVKRCRNR